MEVGLPPTPPPWSAAFSCESVRDLDPDTCATLRNVADAMLGVMDSVLSGAMSFADAAPDRGVPNLSQRQIDVLLLLAEGHANKVIRHQLGIAERTVRSHLTEIYQALGTHSRVHAILRARELGVIE